MGKTRNYNKFKVITIRKELYHLLLDLRNKWGKASFSDTIEEIFKKLGLIE